MSFKSKKKIKFRRKLCREEMFPKKEEQELAVMDWSLRQAFPDKKERLEYMRTLYDKLGEGL